MTCFTHCPIAKYAYVLGKFCCAPTSHCSTRLQFLQTQVVTLPSPPQSRECNGVNGLLIQSCVCFCIGIQIFVNRSCVFESEKQARLSVSRCPLLNKCTLTAIKQTRKICYYPSWLSVVSGS